MKEGITFWTVSPAKSFSGGVRRMKTHQSIITHRAGDAIRRGSLAKPGHGVTSPSMRVEARINP